MSEYLDLARVEGGELRLARAARASTSSTRCVERGRRPRAPADRRPRHAPHDRAAARRPLPPVCCDPTLLRIVTGQPARQRGQVRQRGRRDPRSRPSARRASTASVCGSACGTQGPGFSRRAAEQALPQVLAPRRPGPQEPPRHRRRPVQLLAHRPAARRAHHGRRPSRASGPSSVSRSRLRPTAPSLPAVDPREQAHDSR